RQWKHARVVYVSDSQYLVKGMSEWVAGWEARGWKRKGGVLENQDLWQKLVQAAAAHDVEWRWIEGHAGHAKNEYADTLATRAAERQDRSNGLVPSGFDAWLAHERTRRRYTAYDPDEELYERRKGRRGREHAHAQPPSHRSGRPAGRPHPPVRGIHPHGRTTGQLIHLRPP